MHALYHLQKQNGPKRRMIKEKNVFKEHQISIPKQISKLINNKDSLNSVEKKQIFSFSKLTMKPMRF